MTLSSPALHCAKNPEWAPPGPTFVKATFKLPSQSPTDVEPVCVTSAPRPLRRMFASKLKLPIAVQHANAGQRGTSRPQLEQGNRLTNCPRSRHDQVGMQPRGTPRNETAAQSPRFAMKNCRPSPYWNERDTVKLKTLMDLSFSAIQTSEKNESKDLQRLHLLLRVLLEAGARGLAERWVGARGTWLPEGYTSSAANK